MTHRSFLPTALFLPVFLLLAAAPRAATYTVVNTNDSGAGSLRQALANAGGNAGLDTIVFDVPTTPPIVIRPLSFYVGISDPVILDATTQPGYAGTPDRKSVV